MGLPTSQIQTLPAIVNPGYSAGPAYAAPAPAPLPVSGGYGAPAPGPLPAAGGYGGADLDDGYGAPNLSSGGYGRSDSDESAGNSADSGSYGGGNAGAGQQQAQAGYGGR